MAQREFTRRIKAAARMILSGRESRYYDDELIGFDLIALTPAADAGQVAPRLNVLTTTLSEKAAFGGLATLVELPIQVFAHVLAAQGWTLRFVNLGEAPAPDDDIAARYARRHGLAPETVSACHDAGRGAAVPVGPGDVFMGSLWHSLPAVLPLLRFQQAEFGGPQVPYVSLVQDYEAGFHPWSSAYVLAQAAYDNPWPKLLVFNSRELARFYAAQGHQSEPGHAFRPVMNSALRQALENGPAPAKERRILFYGRPHDRRNCFFLGRRALELWAERYENAGQWRVVSVGADHDPIPLARGARNEVLGKLTLAGYADELHRAAVGLSLMASPHPSYPPLEMAHFGALTLTNRFTGKDMAAWHENFVPLDVADPETLADALVDSCTRFEADPEVGRRGRTLQPHYLEGHDPETLEAIGTLILKAAR